VVIIPSSNKHGETAMTAIAQQDFWQEQADEPVIRIDGRVDPETHDAYWQAAFWAEAYYRDDCTYEDYAPAYCVGYCGHAQYGGDFDDAEKSLCANWVRIKGDSRLTFEEAMQAIRAAWDHAATIDDAMAGESVGAGVLAAQRGRQHQLAFATA
jgi:hypothetical protein